MTALDTWLSSVTTWLSVTMYPPRMMNPDPVPSPPFTLIITTLGVTRAAIPATELAGRPATAAGTVPTL